MHAVGVAVDSRRRKGSLKEATGRGNFLQYDMSLCLSFKDMPLSSFYQGTYSAQRQLEIYMLVMMVAIDRRNEHTNMSLVSIRLVSHLLSHGNQRFVDKRQ